MMDNGHCHSYDSFQQLIYVMTFFVQKETYDFPSVG